MRFYLGSYTDANVKGIYWLDVDGETGKLSKPQLVADVVSPTFLALNPATMNLYAISDAKDFAGEKQNAVVGYSLDPGTLALTELNRQPSGGDGVCYVSTDHSGKVVLVANYSSAHVASYLVQKDGSIGAPVSIHHQEGTGPNKRRQNEPHAHSIIPDPSNKYALSADLGADKIYIYAMDTTTAELTPKPTFACPPGSGPRHMVFHPSGKILYVVCELDATVQVLAWDAAAGSLSPIQTILSLPKDYPLADNTASEITVHPTLPFVYCANRGHDSIAQFSVADDGQLKLLGNTSTHGHGPRHFAIDPTGKTLVVANQHASNVVSYTLDAKTGAPTFTDTFEWHKPMCIRFLPG